MKFLQLQHITINVQFATLNVNDIVQMVAKVQLRGYIS